MAEPFVFCFAPGTPAGPDIMYIADISCACGLCQHPQLQRFYHAAPFHPMLPSTLTTLATSVHNKANYECENCGTQVGPEHVKRGVLRFAFPDDAGMVTIHVHDITSPSPQLFYEYTPQHRLDPQVQPTFEPGDDAVDQLHLEDMERAFSRVFNPKTLWRALFAQWRDNPEGGAWAQAAPGYWLCIDTTEALLEESMEEIDNANNLTSIPLMSPPQHLPFHTHALAGRPETWLDPEDLEALERGEVFAEALVSPQVALDVLTRALETARLTWEEEEDEDGGVFITEVTTPREGVLEQDISLDDVLHRAVYTGITPGEAARLTAEEVVGRLLRVWK